MGGVDSNKHQVLEMTEENGFSWAEKADLPATRSNAASIVHEGQIWVMGGRVDGSASGSVITYDADADAWETAPPIPNPPRVGRATAIDGCILLHAPYRGDWQRVTMYKDAAWSDVEVIGTGSGSGGAPCGTVLLG